MSERSEAPHDQIPSRTPTPGSALSHLQRTAGNRALGRVLARRSAKRPRAARQTGLRRDAAIRRYVRKAVGFLSRNGDLPLRHYAIYLGAAVNEELAAVGVPAVRVSIAKGSMYAAAHFDAEAWEMVLNPAVFTTRPEVELMGDLDADEAASVAKTVYHEARHAEQRFRVARMLAGEGGEHDVGLHEDVARAAAAAPLHARGAAALELREARSWHAITLGEDSTYREAVVALLAPALAAARAARDVVDDGAAELRESLGRQLRGWTKPGGPGDYIRSHLASARSRNAAPIVKEIAVIHRRFARAEAAWKALPEQPAASDFTPLAAALADLYRSISAAYHGQANEHDAHDVGDATSDAFARALQASRRGALGSGRGR